MFAVIEVSLFNLFMMKPSLFLALTISFLTVSLFAQTAQNEIPTNEQASAGSIEKLLRVTEMDLMVEGMVENMQGILDQQIKNTIDSEKLTDMDVPALESLRNQLQDWISMEISWDRLSPMYVEAYGRFFTQKEIDDMISFFSSDSGRSFISKQQELQGMINYLLQTNMKTFMDRFQSRFNVLMTDLVDNRKSIPTAE